METLTCKFCNTPEIIHPKYATMRHECGSIYLVSHGEWYSADEYFQFICELISGNHKHVSKRFDNCDMCDEVSELTDGLCEPCYRKYVH